MDEIRSHIVMKNLENMIKETILDHKKGFESIIRTNAIFGNRARY